MRNFTSVFTAWHRSTNRENYNFRKTCDGNAYEAFCGVAPNDRGEAVNLPPFDV